MNDETPGGQTPEGTGAEAEQKPEAGAPQAPQTPMPGSPAERGMPPGVPMPGAPEPSAGPLPGAVPMPGAPTPGAPMPGVHMPGAPMPGGPAGYPGSYPGAGAPPDKASGMATVSLVLSAFGVLCGITAIAGIVLGVIELNRIKRGESSPKGKGLAMAGVIVGAIIIGLSLIFTIIAIATGNFSFEVQSGS